MKYDLSKYNINKKNKTIYEKLGANKLVSSKSDHKNCN